jgi:pyruvate dehydrogenase E1 component alpha subunit
VGVMAALEPSDRVVATYREHGHALAKGTPAARVMAEMFGKVEGCSRGRGGSMHLFDVEHGLYGGNAIVAGGLPLGVGLAFGDRYLGQPHVTVVFFGDGAAAEGEFHESINLALLWNVPVLFVCENNLYAMGTALRLEHADTDLTTRAASYGIEAEWTDGMDVLAVEAAARRAVDSMRAGGGPRFLELRTYRFRAHSLYDADRYRDPAEIERWKERDPIEALARQLTERGALDADARAAIEADVTAEIDEAVRFADAGTFEAVDDLTRFVMTEAT